MNRQSVVSVHREHELGEHFEPFVIRCLIHSPSFVRQFRSLVTDDLFRVALHSYLSKLICDFFDQYREIPTIDVLCDLARQGDFKDRGGVIQLIKESQPAENESYVVERLLKWARWTKIEQVLEADGREDPKLFASRVDAAARHGEHLLGGEVVLSSDLEFSSEDTRGHQVPTPWVWLNDRLSGGPESGDLCIIDAFINVGKTALLVNMATTGLANGEIVVYGTFEDGESKIRRRFFQNVGDMTKEDVIAEPAVARNRMVEFLASSGGKLFIKRLRNKRTTVGDFGAYIKSVEDREGRPVRLAISDYGDRFAAPMHRKDPRHEYREIFEECKLLAGDLQLVHWSATQANRAAKGREIVGLEFTGEALGKVEGADLVLGAGQTEEDVQLGFINLFTAKMRDAKKHEALRLVADLDKQRIYES